MVITVSPKKGIKCQVGDLSLIVDPEKASGTNLTIFTKTAWPIKSVSGDVIQGGGEYEVSGIKIRGIGLDKESDKNSLKTAYVVSMDDMKMCFLGEIKAELDDSILEKIGEADILFMAVGDGGLDVKKAASVIKKIEPKLVIPTTQSKIKELGSELGQKPAQEEKLVIKKRDIGESNLKLIWIAEK